MIVVSFFTPSDRAEVFQHLWRVLAQAADTNEAVRREIHAWIDARSEDENGFLWLVGRLGMRPSVLEETLRTLATANAQRRRHIQRRVQEALREAQCAAE